VSDEYAIELTGVARRFGHRWVLRGLDERVRAGEAVALVGRNGSGKTTLLRILSTTLRPHRGTARIFGYDVSKQSDDVREHVGLLGHSAGLYDDLTAFENLAFAQRMFGHSAEPKPIDEALERVGLAAFRDDRARGFSSGMRRRLSLARIMLRRPKLLLLDEPFASFDEEGIERVYEIVREVVAAGGSAFIATHDLTRAKPVIDRVVRIEDGKLVQVPNDRQDDYAAALRIIDGGA
jgi:heme ABC exporter ATP-binding subunit CcmA